MTVSFDKITNIEIPIIVPIGIPTHDINDRILHNLYLRLLNKKYPRTTGETTNIIAVKNKEKYDPILIIVYVVSVTPLTACGLVGVIVLGDIIVHFINGHICRKQIKTSPDKNNDAKNI